MENSNLYDNNLEQAVLSCALIDVGTWAEMAVKPEHFHNSRHVFIAQAFENMLKAGAEIDLLTIANELEKNNLLAEIGGSAYLTQLITSAPTTLSAITYAEEIKDLAARRKLLEAATKMAQLAHDRGKEFQTIATTAREHLDNSLNSGNAPKGRTLAEAASHYMDQIESRIGQDYQTIGISTGYYDLDLKLDGLRDGKYYLIAARPGAGKTAMLGNLAINAAKLNKKVLFFSVEMFSDEIVSRLLAAEIDINTRLLDHAKLEQDQWEQSYQALESFENLQFRIFNPNECFSVERIDSITRQHYARGEVDIIFVDYVQLLQLERGSSTATREQEVTKITQTLKRITHLNIPVIAAAQLSRAVELRSENRPQLSDLRESGSLEQEADAVCFLWQPDKEQDTSLEFLISKNRGGALGECPLYYDKATQKILSATRERVILNP